MEKQLFTWVSWEVEDTMAFSFMDCELKLAIGEHPAGTKFSSIEMDYGKGELVIWKTNEDLVRNTPEIYLLKLVVGTKIK